MKQDSRLSGFRRVGVAERTQQVAEATDCESGEITSTLAGGGLDAETADKFVENVLGTYALPYGVALNARVNGRDYIVPMVVEEPSVVAAASNAAKMVRAGGGFHAEADPPLMIGQIQLLGVRDPAAAAERIVQRKRELLTLADAAIAGLVGRGGGARDLEVRVLGEPADQMLCVHILVDCQDAMGANLVNTVAEAAGERLARIANARVGLRIVSNLADRRRVRVSCSVPGTALETDAMSGEKVIDGLVGASRFAELDPYRAATHNKGIMNGIDSVVIATGNDWRAVEAGAHAFAARSGHYAPLSTWRRGVGVDAQPCAIGHLELPLAVGTVGGTLRVHPAARLSLRLLGVQSAGELASIAASVGLASNLAALRALATVGIQLGHTALHARAVALAAGATGDQVQLAAQMMVEARNVTLEGAKEALRALGRRRGAVGGVRR